MKLSPLVLLVLASSAAAQTELVHYDFTGGEVEIRHRFAPTAEVWANYTRLSASRTISSALSDAPAIAGASELEKR